MSFKTSKYQRVGFKRVAYPFQTDNRFPAQPKNGWQNETNSRRVQSETKSNTLTGTLR